MLVLTRKVGEKIFINGNISVEVLEIENGRIRLGIVAPEEVKIARQELLKKEEQAKRTAK